MQPLIKDDGHFTRATVYTAFAMKENGSDTVEVMNHDLAFDRLLRFGILRFSQHLAELRIVFYRKSKQRRTLRKSVINFVVSFTQHPILLDFVTLTVNSYIKGSFPREGRGGIHLSKLCRHVRPQSICDFWIVLPKSVTVKLNINLCHFESINGENLSWKMCRKNPKALKGSPCTSTNHFFQTLSCSFMSPN